MEHSQSLKIDYRGVRVVVLGAAGFIGRWVARALTQAGAELFLFVWDQASATSLEHYEARGEVIALDLRKADLLQEALGEIRPSITFNLVGYGINPSEQDEQAAYQINAALVEILCRQLSRLRDPQWKGQDLVHVGSGVEYGSIGGDLSEESTPIPNTLYGKSKLAGTLVLSQFSKQLGIRGLTARLFTVYGPGEHPWRLLPSLIKSAKSGKDLDLSAGEQKRDFTYVGDVAEGLLRLGLATANPGEAVNLATGCLTSVRQFVNTAAEILNIPAERLKFGAIPSRAWEIEHDPVRLERLRQLTAWTPPTGIAQGIHSTTVFEDLILEGDEQDEH